ncbi:MAG: Rieske 2Fe-2S domain-containing protein [Chloroflexota bacterium]|nr:Rieske 2Fe-2S domain-containing protein [Chloroflexota bacterium]
METVRAPEVISGPVIQDLDGWSRVGRLEEMRGRGCTALTAHGHTVAVFCTDDRAFAVDNRCPHMGFPLDRGTVQNGILTCHWHHARFDLESGGTFDPFAGDVRVYPTRIVDGDVWVNLNPPAEDPVPRWKARLRDGLEQNISLVLAKSVLALLKSEVPAPEITSIGGAFGARFRRQGWGPGLTILTAMGNVFPRLAPDDGVLALYHGMVHVASDVAGEAPRFSLDPLPTRAVPPDRLKVWFRRFVEVRDVEGAERTLLTTIHGGLDVAAVSDLMLAACTDHYFLAGGHTLDFINKGFEYLELTGWAEAEIILPSLVRGLCMAQRSEELNSWRNPVDLVELLEPAFARLPETIAASAGRQPEGDLFADLVPTLLGDDPSAGIASLLEAIEAGHSLEHLGLVLTYAAALRVARFHTSNEFSDWITVLHTFTYCNALHRSLRRSPSPELARGIFHGAMRIYLDRFLNMPAARLPDEQTTARLPVDAGELLVYLDDLLNREQQVNRAGDAVYRYLAQGHEEAPLLALLGHLLLREDGEFHSYQMLEAGLRQYDLLHEERPQEARHVLIGAARYLAAHAPTSRAMLQTGRTAMRLARGEAIWESEEGR